MDEQTTQSTVREWEATADGVVNAGYEEEAASPEPETGGELSPDGVRIDGGEVEFGDKFFGDMPEAPKPEPEAPKWYSPDELRNTPYEQWDVERLHGDIKEFVPIVREQLQARQRQEQLSRVPEVPKFLEAPHQYTPKELAEEAQRLACERLGLGDPEDFDEYEGEHRAAQQMAMQELIQRQMADSQAYETGKKEWAELQRFNAELAAQPDFEDFNRWYMSKLQERGVTHPQVEAELMRYARENGNRFGVVAQIIGNWYREYHGSQKRPSGNERKVRAVAPAVLEGTRGGESVGRARVNAREFGNMDDMEQEEAIMRMGLV